MAYNFEQFLSSKRDNYLSSITNYTIRDLITVGDDGTRYIDKKISYQMDSFTENGVCYYLKLQIKKIAETNSQIGEQEIIVRLAHSNNDKDKQILQTIHIPKYIQGEDQYQTFDFIIAPNDNYDEIQFSLHRKTIFDTRTVILNTDPETIKYAEIINIIPTLNTSSGTSTLSKLKQIGIQGPVGLQMCIDGESIKIGRTGIYEINHGYTISFLGFIYKENENDKLKPFILDYQY